MRTMTDEERAAAIARVTFLLPGLTDVGLQHVREMAERAAQLMARDLSSGALAAEQRARYGLLADADEVLSRARRERTHGASCDCAPCSHDLHDTASDAAAVIGSTVHAVTKSGALVHGAGRSTLGGQVKP